MTNKCYECKTGILAVKKIDYILHGTNLGKFEAEVCGSCNEQFFSTDTSKKIELTAKKLGVWGLSAVTKVGKNGNSLDIRLSKQIAKFLGLTQGKEVFLQPESRKRLIIEVQE